MLAEPYTLPEWPAFVRGIRENHADDVPRLAAADWLDERGEAARAEFIRLHVEYAKPRDQWSAGLYDRIAPHADGRWFHWACRLVPNVSVSSSGLSWDYSACALTRGFIEGWRLTAEEWFIHGDGVYAAEPVRRVRLATAPNLRVLPSRRVSLRLGDERWYQEAIISAGGHERMVVTEQFVSPWAAEDAGADRVRREAIARLDAMTQPANVLATLWPGVTFELPSARTYPVAPGQVLPAGTPVTVDSRGRATPVFGPGDRVVGHVTGSGPDHRSVTVAVPPR